MCAARFANKHSECNIQKTRSHSHTHSRTHSLTFISLFSRSLSSSFKADVLLSLSPFLATHSQHSSHPSSCYSLSLSFSHTLFISLSHSHIQLNVHTWQDFFFVCGKSQIEIFKASADDVGDGSFIRDLKRTLRF